MIVLLSDYFVSFFNGTRNKNIKKKKGYQIIVRVNKNLVKYIENIDMYTNQFLYNGNLVKLSLAKEDIVLKRINFKYERMQREFKSYKKLKNISITTLINSILLFAENNN